MPQCIPWSHNTSSPNLFQEEEPPKDHSELDTSSWPSNHSDHDTSPFPSASPQTEAATPPQSVRKSIRHKTKPRYLEDYQCNTSISS
ncbi:hypothetical protein SESBI_35427 [Sesbania bispinosa]|nr:hypothetical protein SESBI_35427 [Sesbania bispinosa]